MALMGLPVMRVIPVLLVPLARLDLKATLVLSALKATREFHITSVPRVLQGRVAMPTTEKWQDLPF